MGSAGYHTEYRPNYAKALPSPMRSTVVVHLLSDIALSLSECTARFSFAIDPRYYLAVLSPVVDSPSGLTNSSIMGLVIPVAGWEPSGAE